MIDPGFTAPVLFGTQAGHDVRNHFLRGLILSGVADDDAVTVEPGLGENFGGVRSIMHRDDESIHFIQIDQHLPGGSQQLFALWNRIVDRCKSQFVGALEQVIRVFQHRPSPPGRLDDLRGANPPIPVSIDDFQGLCVDFQARSRAAESHPQLLVEPIQRGQISPVLQMNLIESTHSFEFPTMCRGGAFFRCIVCHGTASLKSVRIFCHSPFGL